MLAVQSARFKAMTEVNLAVLGTTLADDLTYTHTTGTTETKAEFLAQLESGALEYRSIEPRQVQVRMFGDAALITGESEMRVAAQGRQFSLSIRFVEVYRQTAGSWQLVAWQSTRMRP